MAAEADQWAWQLRREMLDELLEQTENRRVSVTLGGADRIITESLRPALKEVVDQARKAVAACRATTHRRCCSLAAPRRPDHRPETLSILSTSPASVTT